MGHLNVVIPPDIVSDETSGDTMVSEGSSVRLRCQARGYPEPTVVWRREDGRNITLREPGQSKKEGQLHWCLGHFIRVVLIYPSVSHVIGCERIIRNGLY